MRRGRSIRTYLALTCMVAYVIGALVGCSKSSQAEQALDPTTPNEAAVQVEKVFQEAAPEIKQGAEDAAQALRTGDYEQAIERLYTVRQGTNVTMEQGMAIQRAMATMEYKLMQAVEAGDEKAKKAYELLRARNRN